MKHGDRIRREGNRTVLTNKRQKGLFDLSNDLLPWDRTSGRMSHNNTHYKRESVILLTLSVGPELILFLFKTIIEVL